MLQEGVMSSYCMHIYRYITMWSALLRPSQRHDKNEKVKPCRCLIFMKEIDDILYR